MQVWLINARMAVQLYEFRDAITNQIIPDAAITAKLIDPATGLDVVGSSFTVPYVGDVPGHYGGTSPQLPITPNSQYLCDVEGFKAGSRIYAKQVQVVAGNG